ncbi:zinc finger protein 43-like [Melitaea cinxia]|uniref:zinc finger protein 43-like n=1 Tax=Melitaea cinxia TaxID=113334 RepID=UPI001E274020|nr:zinc finger protein 43-like [Melitaea cinxia]
MDDNIDLDNDNICGVCYAEFLDVDDLKLHIKQYHLNETNKSRFCKFCSKIFSDIWSFVIHFRNCHLITIRICKYCTRVFNDDKTLSKHEKKHKRSLYYPKISCSQCRKVFKDNKEVEDHEYERHRDRDDGMLLQYCYPELSAAINFNARKFFQSLEEHFMYSCVVCDLSTIDVNEYVNHLQKKKCQSYSCNVCCNTYPWKSRLENHCKTHQMPKYTILSGSKKCPKCDQYFQLSKIKTHSKECKSMKCIPCDMLFDSVDNFAIHVSTHCQRNPVQFENCKYCRRPFIAPTQLKKHIKRAHTHNIHLYKYCCIYCDILFRHPKQLFGHFFTKHRDINPYTCKICNTGFRIRKNFTLHIKLDHKSVGFVEFDSNYHVFFNDKKSEKPFQPKNPYLADLSDKNSNKRIKETVVKKELSSDDNIYKGTSSYKENTDQTSGANETQNQENTINIIVKEDKTENFNETTNEKTTPQTDTKTSENTDATLKDQETQPKGNKDLEKQTAQKSDPKTTKDEVHKLIEVDEQTPAKNVEVGINCNSDSMHITEAEGDNDNRRVQKRKHKSQIDKPRKRSKIKSQSDCESSDSDVPLSKIVNKSKKGRRWKVTKRYKNTKDASSSKKTKFICLKCDRNCYTYQNYHRHMNLHMKNGKKVCVKCFAKFKTKEELNNHIKTEHSSSKLTETLKKLLDKRKSSETQKTKLPENLFSKTIHKVQFEAPASQATINKVLEDKLSVKKFLETFKPDANDGTTKKISISNSLSIRPVTNVRTEPIIKMNKFKQDLEQQITHRPQLRMPVKFKEESVQDYHVSVKLVECEYVAPALNFDNEVTVSDDYVDHIETDNIQNKAEVIPEVGREILLGESQANKTKVLKKTIDLKDLISYDKVRIGHLAPQAPYYKIVKIEEVLQDKQKKVEPPKDINITLPNGTKLVSVNPLAHLLSKKTVADIPKSNTYNKKPNNNKDFREAILKAMKVLEKTPPKRKSVKKGAIFK